MRNSIFCIRPMGENDLESVVTIHQKSFRGFFLTFLGHSFLKVFYSFVLSEKRSISIVAESFEDKKVVAFVVGTTEPEGFYSRAIRREGMAFIVAAIPAIVKDPRIITRLFRALKKPKEARENIGDCELMSIAVLPNTSSNGVGTKLEAAFCEEAKKRKAKMITLTTDKRNNDHVNMFYKKCGYSVYDSFVTPEGREMNRYIKDIFSEI